MVWSLLTARVMANEEYQGLFGQAYPNSDISEISFVHIANAIGAFEAAAFRADNSPFDRYLRGEKSAMSKNAKKGWKLFKGKANCISCHSGALLTDQDFYSIGIPQIGPGKGDGPSGFDDYGRERVTGEETDRYKFRTPTLRNVALTGPWGHDGAYDTLEGIVRHHLDPVQALAEYDLSQAALPSRTDLDVLDLESYKLLNQEDTERMQIFVEAIDIKPVYLNDREVQWVMDFLYALTDPDSLDMRWTVPSGLPVAD
jgi:cytochrome c peroxidase